MNEIINDFLEKVKKTLETAEYEGISVGTKYEDFLKIKTSLPKPKITEEYVIYYDYGKFEIGVLDEIILTIKIPSEGDIYVKDIESILGKGEFVSHHIKSSLCYGTREEDCVVVFSFKDFESTAIETTIASTIFMD